jgi:hypothetical protein
MIFALILCAAGQLPAGCLTLPAGHSGSIAGPWCCPVKIGPTLPARGAADVLRSRPVADVLPVVLPAPSLGKRCRPVVLPGQDRPHAPGPSTPLYAAQLRRAGIAPYDRHMPRCPTVLTPSTGISPSDSVTPICITLEEV